MIRIGESQIPAAPRLAEQGRDDLLPDPPALIFEQASMTGLRRGGNVMGQVFPLAARFEDVQDAIEDFPFVRPRASGPRAFRQQGLEIAPLGIRHVRAVRLARRLRNMV